MRNYIILNGISSNEIEGLIISNLPPISKPKIRTSVQEIDGMDGDIVTKLGYSAYDKSFDIGLSYGYNVDDVITFFNSKGFVVFSNEPTKYYRYEIVEQIDLERLIRFKKANVKMHVQPFKYSAVEKAKTFTNAYNNFLEIPQFNKTVNGITLEANNNIINVHGSCSRNTEIYLPINELNLNTGTYVLSAVSSGENTNNCAIRLINSSPSNSNSFGGNYLRLNNGVATIGETLTQVKKFNYLWLFIDAGSTVNFTLTLTLKANITSFVVKNSGNYFSKPKLLINGSGIVGIYLNNYQVFKIDMTKTSQIFIDVEKMNAYYNDGTYANRIVTGKYDNFILKHGENTIGFDGNITSLTISNYSRWV